MNDLIWRRCSTCDQLNLVPATLDPCWPCGETRCERCTNLGLLMAPVDPGPAKALAVEGQQTRSFFGLALRAPSPHAPPAARADLDVAYRLLASVFPDGVDL
jgi:hypothetical protein